MATRADHLDHGREPSNPIDRIGRTVVYEGELLRHRSYTRFLHWMYGIFFFLALLSGFGIYLPWIFRWFTPLFGGGAITRLLHPWFGLGFVFFFFLQALNWRGAMRWLPTDSIWMRRIKEYVTHRETMESEDVGFFNAGQKVQFWEIVYGSIAFVITGIVMWFPTVFGRILVSISYVIHDISALIMLAGIFVHIYLSTFGEPGTIQAMTRGTVSEPWAWTHHPGWFKQITGRDPKKSVEEARLRMSREPRQSDPTKSL
jgi:formate dehydrogenase subunit gamma